jgi:hypothetical protein
LEGVPVDKSTQSASSASAVGVGGAIATISTSPESEARLRALVAERGPELRIRLAAPADLEVTGHQLSTATLAVNVVDEDDTEGHAISLHFPRAEEAKEFERRLLATGAIVGTLVIAGGGLALSQALPDATRSTQTQVESGAEVQPAAAPIYVSGASPTGGQLTGKQEAVLEEIVGADVIQIGGRAVSDDVMSGKEKALLSEITEGEVSEATDDEITYPAGDELTGKEKALLSEITGDE